jgi:hypothetical protein
VRVARRDAGGESDIYCALIEYKPEQGIFEIRRDACRFVEELRAEEELTKAIDDMLAGEIPFLEKFPCPICDGTVQLFLNQSDGRPAFMSICGGAHCDGCGYGRELCGLQVPPDVMQFVKKCPPEGA